MWYFVIAGIMDSEGKLDRPDQHLKTNNLGKVTDLVTEALFEQREIKVAMDPYWVEEEEFQEV